MFYFDFVSIPFTQVVALLVLREVPSFYTARYIKKKKFMKDVI